MLREFEKKKERMFPFFSVSSFVQDVINRDCHFDIFGKVDRYGLDLDYLVLGFFFSFSVELVDKCFIRVS